MVCVAELRSLQESAFLEVMNSAPVVNGVVTDYLDDPVDAVRILSLLGGDGSGLQVRAVRGARNALQEIIRSGAPITDLLPHLAGVARRPSLVDGAIRWGLEAAADDLPAARLVVAWSELSEEMPGRLRPCANPDCTKFLIDHSKPNSARWCSMATCGNRLKARRYQARHAAEG